jgi:NADH-quinone oxidoreductase subunit L
MMTLATNLVSAMVGLAPAAHAAAAVVPPVAGPSWAGWILWLPALSALLCGLCAALRVKNKAPAVITVALLGASFVLTAALFWQHTQTSRVHLFDWFDLHWGTGEQARSFVAPFALYIDSLMLLWMLFVTGLGTLIALYAGEYMEGDVGKGYTRFFAGVSIFLFAMSSLVMGDNLVMLYLGWEGVGLASYLLIGYHYQKPSAVAAAKKAFIMNRIGDLGLALGIWLIYHYFGTVEYTELFAKLAPSMSGEAAAGGWPVKAIPFLLMLGAFGKSAQLPLYVWLPDAMEGPTPVSALIHAATMVTAGVYLLCRMFPVMGLHEGALPTVAWIGAATAFLAATIGMAQHDIKRIMAYSTVSQLGYMFVGVGVMTTFGAAYHVFTHAFFKAVLFLTCGAVMHGFAGQLDLRKISGLRHMPGWKVTAYAMLIGCLCLAGFPGTSGYFSKDVILAETFVNQQPGSSWGFNWLGWLLLLTAGLTAYYTFRVWFRVCAGPVQFEMGDEHHGEDDAAHGHGPGRARDPGAQPRAAHAADAHHGHHGHDQPHPPRFAINLVLTVIAIGALLAAAAYFMPHYGDGSHGWVKHMVGDSSAAVAEASHGAPAEHAAPTPAHGTLLGFDPHQAMYFVSAAVGFVGIIIAFILHRSNRPLADRLKAAMLGNPLTRVLARGAERKWYVDELYDITIVKPLWFLGGWGFALFDKWVIDWMVVDGIAKLPRKLARSFQPLQNGIVQSYAVSMAGGVGLIAVLVIYMPQIRQFVGLLLNGGGD